MMCWLLDDLEIEELMDYVLKDRRVYRLKE